MYFKTKVGFVHVDGFYQINVNNTYHIAGVAYRGISAQRQETALAPRGILKSFWEGSVSYPVAGSYYLATFEDDENIEVAVGECMTIISRAIEQNAAICDLSGQGTRDGWNNKWLAIRWAS